MNGSGKKVAEVPFKASKEIDWEGLASMLVSVEARKEFSNLRRSFDEQPQPVDWEYYRKGIGSHLTECTKKLMTIPKFVDIVTLEYEPKFDQLLVELKEAEEASLKESAHLEKEIAEVQELKRLDDEYFAEHPELRKKLDDEIRNDYLGY